MFISNSHTNLKLKPPGTGTHTHRNDYTSVPDPFPPVSLPAARVCGLKNQTLKKSSKILYWLCGENAVGTKLLHLQTQKHRQQPSHLRVINPYSPSAAFLPFTAYCLKLKRRAEGKALKLQS